ncbi:hypothetical protein KH5_19590 [Urechidicola sp. KH5]
MNNVLLFSRRILQIVVLGYFVLAILHFVNLPIGLGDEQLFISDLKYIKKFGWSEAISKGISIPYMLLVYPLSTFFEDYLSMRLINLILLTFFFVYILYRKKGNTPFSYFLFFFSTVYYFFIGTNDAVFIIGIVIFLNEVNTLQKSNRWNAYLAIGALIISTFSRELIIVYFPIVLIGIYIIYLKRGLKKNHVIYSVILCAFFFLLNVPSINTNRKLSFDSKLPPIDVKATWVQRQYLAQLMVNNNILSNYQHPTWKQTDEYLRINGEKSLPKNIYESIFFDFSMTIKEFFKDLFSCFYLGFRQLGLILFIPLFFFMKNIIRNKQFKAEMFVPISLIIMFCIFSFIIISYVELRWLSPFLIMMIFNYNDLEKNKLINEKVLIFNNLILIILTFYGSFKLMNKLLLEI